jgi:hypothetical protein
MGWTVQGLNPSREEIFHNHLDWSWGPLSFLYNGYWVFPGVKWPGHVTEHPPPSSAKVIERVELSLYYPTGPSWSVRRQTLPFTFTFAYVVFYFLHPLPWIRKLSSRIFPFQESTQACTASNKPL